MLVLSRKVGESLKIGDAIEITVVRVTGGGVALGVRAPRDIPVLRGELAVAISRQNVEAVQNAPPAEVLEGLSSMLGPKEEETPVAGRPQESRAPREGTRRNEARPKAPKRRP